LRKAETTYRRLRQRFEAAARLFVLAGYAELVAGEPMPLEETFAARREFVRNRRQQQEARRQRATAEHAQRSKRGTPRQEVTESIEDMPILAIADVGMHSEASITRATRPRKRVGEPESAAIVTDGAGTDEHFSEGEA
jgi:hypothetical protein